jgi:putative ABC transport system permease protein
MMRHAGIAWKNILHSRRQTIAVSLLAFCAMALMLIGSFLGHGLRGGLTRAVEPFDMLAGRGGSYQIVLNTVFLQDYPAGNISYRLVGEFNGDERIESAIPLAFGDNYKGYRIVGTDTAIFSHFSRAGDFEPWLHFACGAPFAPGSRGAVVGGRAAADLGLEIGDTFVSTHGFAQGGNDHAHAPYTVSGILDTCKGPYDQAIFVDIRSIWEAHADHEHEDGDDDHDHGHHDGEEKREVTAIMVKPSGFADAYRIFTDYSGRNDVELVFPSQVVVRLLSVLGQADWLLQAIGYAAGAIAALTIILSLYWSASSRENEALVLRLIGAEKQDIVAILTWEGLLSITPGLVVGCAAGHAILAGIATILERKAALHIDTGPGGTDAALILALLLSGVVGEMLAAIQLTRNPAG